MKVLASIEVQVRDRDTKNVSTFLHISVLKERKCLWENREKRKWVCIFIYFCLRACASVSFDDATRNRSGDPLPLPSEEITGTKCINVQVSAASIQKHHCGALLVSTRHIVAIKRYIKHLLVKPCEQSSPFMKYHKPHPDLLIKYKYALKQWCKIAIVLCIFGSL